MSPFLYTDIKPFTKPIGPFRTILSRCLSPYRSRVRGWSAPDGFQGHNYGVFWC